VHDTHVLMHLYELILRKHLLGSLAHRFVIENYIFHLLMVHFGIRFAHHPVKLLRIKVILYQLSKLVRRLRPQLREYFLGFFIRVCGFKDFSDADVDFHVFIVGAHDIIHLLDVVRIVFFGLVLVPLELLEEGSLVLLVDVLDLLD